MLPDRRRILRSLLVFTLVFVALSWPMPGLGRALALAYSNIGNVLLHGDRELAVRFTPAGQQEPVARAWVVVLCIQRAGGQPAHIDVDLDLRKAFWIPFCVFAALACASPVWTHWRTRALFAFGLVLLQLPFVLSIALHASALMYLRGVIDLSERAQAWVQFGYALLAPPGMVYAIPLLLWAALMLCNGNMNSARR